MKKIFFCTILSLSGYAQSVFVFPRLGQDFIINSQNYAKGGRYVFENMDLARTPSNWYAGVGIMLYNPSNHFRFNLDLLFNTRNITATENLLKKNYLGSNLNSKVLVKYATGDIETKNHFYVALGGGYNYLIDQKYYENDKIVNNKDFLNTGGLSAIGGIGYQWIPTSSIRSTNEVIFDLGIFYNKDLYPYLNNSNYQNSYINLSMSVRGVTSLFFKNLER